MSSSSSKKFDCSVVKKIGITSDYKMTTTQDGGKSITRQTEDEFRTEVKFRFGPAFIAYATAQPQPKPIFRLHSAHKIKDLTLGKLGLRPAYLRNKCPHGLGELALGKDTLKASYLRNKCQHNPKLMACLAKEMSLSRQLKLDCPPPPPPPKALVASPKSVCSATFDYNPMRDDGHGLALPLCLTRKILRMREPFPSHGFKMECEEYQKAILAFDEDAFSSRDLPPFKLHLAMKKRFKKTIKDRNKQMRKWMKRMEKQTPYDHTPDSSIRRTSTSLAYLKKDLPLGSGFPQRKILPSPLDEWQANYGKLKTRVVDKCGVWEDETRSVIVEDTYKRGELNKNEASRIGWQYEEYRQLRARGIIKPAGIIDTANIVSTGRHLGEFVIKAMLGDTTCSVPDLCELLPRRFRNGSQNTTPYTPAEHSNFQACLRNLGEYRVGHAFQNNGIVIYKFSWENELNDASAYYASEQPFRWMRKQLDETNRANKKEFTLTRKRIVNNADCMSAVKEAFDGEFLGEICGETAFRKTLPYVVARFKEFEAFAWGSWRYDHGNTQYIRYPLKAVLGTANRYGVRIPHAIDYHGYWEKATTPAQTYSQGSKILRTDMALWRAYVKYNLSECLTCQPSACVAGHMGGRMLCELRNTGRATAVRTGTGAGGRGRHGGAELLRKNAKLEVGGVVVFNSKPKKAGKYKYIREAGVDLRLPFMNEANADGVRYAEIDYAENDLLITENIGPCANPFMEHEVALDGGNYYVRGWQQRTDGTGLELGKYGSAD